MAKKKKTKKELIAENEWLMSLPWLPRTVIGTVKYKGKELLIGIIVIILGLWFLTSFGYIGKHVTIKPGVNIQYNKQ
ncbi:MAG: hypothetical protein CVV44_03920 [Spirochaetae bacterium HGW-Spirochaetae-1]|jgi:hypothetical protein|nr:MAG: hypothetical protein CVV44_03920 [Spirochaetae bacterium HGW-Spirochaetae-1]